MSGPKDEAGRKAKALREQAEAILASNKPGPSPPVSEKTLHELQVHQIELEMQNEELRRAQTELEHLKDHYQDLFDFAPVGYLSLNPDGVILEINLTAAKLLQLDRANILNKRFAKFIVTEYQDLWHQHFYKAKRADGKYGCELPFKTVNGDIFYYHLDCLFDGKEIETPRLRITLTDITERKQIETELRIAAAAFETQDCIVIASSSRHILRVNQAFSRVTGYSAEEVKSLGFFNAESNDTPFHREMWSAIFNDGHWRGELWEYKKNGEPLLLAINISSVKDKHGVVTHYVADFIDITERYKNEQALRWNEELNRKILQAFPAHIAVIDAQGVIISANEAWTKLAQDNSPSETHELAVGANYLDVCRRASVMADEDAARALAGIEAVLSGTIGIFNMEYPCDSPQEHRWYLMFCVPMVLADVVGAVIVHQNITKRKLAEIALTQSEARYRHLLENQTDIICRYKPDGPILYVNEAYCRLFGKSKVYLEGQQWQPMVWPEDLPIVLEKLKSVSPSNPIVTIENRVIAAKGEVRWVQFVNRATFGSNGDCLETQSVGRDITERKKNDEALRIAAAAFEAQESIMVTDANRAIQRVNEAFTRITGYRAKEAIGKNPRILRSGLHDKQFYDHIMEKVAIEGYWQGEIWNKRKNGEIYPALQTITMVTNENGELTHYVGSLVDITIQKQAEKILLDSRVRLENQVANSQEELDRIKVEIVETNIALNVLLRQRDADKIGAKEALTDEVEATLLPLIKKLKAASARRLQSLRLIKLLEENLQNLVELHGHSGTLTATYKKLTPLETQVVAMIRQGHPTKVIAAALNIAPGTVSIHRKHIRKKLGLDGQKDNLYNFLKSLID